MTHRQVPGNNLRQGCENTALTRPTCSEQGFTLVEMLISLLILAGSFIALATAFPLATLTHRGALEKEIAGALAQRQMEHFLANPGPVAGQTGTTSNFVNAAQFPTGYTGSFSAVWLNGVPGLTQIIVTVTPPHISKVEISAIDTTFSNLVP